MATDTDTHTETLAEKAERFWGTDLAELERSFGVNDVLALPTTETDTRVPPSGVFLPVSYLPEE